MDNEGKVEPSNDSEEASCGASLLIPSDRRIAIRIAHQNALVWGIGNGLATTTLVIYLALALGAEGIAISLLLAAAPLVGVLRLGAPTMIHRLGGHKPVCLTGFIFSAVLVFFVPILSAPHVLGNHSQSIAALVALWAIYHLLEYIAVVSLWAWLRQVAPPRIRGKFIGIRQRYLVLGQIIGMLTGGLFAWAWRQNCSGENLWQGYALPALGGAVILLMAGLLLLQMPSFSLKEKPPSKRDYLAPLRNSHFRRLLLFICWFSFVTGITQSAQAIYPQRILGFSLLVMLSFKIGMRLGQSGLASPVGSWVDRIGNRPIMLLSQILVSCGPLFYLVAGIAGLWWMAGAWIVWIGYIGLNIGLPNLMMKLSPPGKSSTYFALYFAASGLFAGLGTITGGFLFEQILPSLCKKEAIPLDPYQILFIGGAIARMFGLFLLWRLIEPAEERGDE